MNHDSPKKEETVSSSSPENQGAAVPSSGTLIDPEVMRILGPLLALLLVFSIFAMMVPLGWMNENFLSWRNFTTILLQSTIVSIAALGMTMIIASGGIDLSVGSTIALVTVVIAWTLNHMMGAPEEMSLIGGWFFTLGNWVSVPVAISLVAALFGVIVGAGVGVVNGLLITRLKVVPFIVTLGTMLIVRGAAKGISESQRITCPETFLGEIMAVLPKDRRWMLVPPGVWILLLLSLAMILLLRYTKLGRYSFAIGSNEQTAVLCGVHVDRTKILIYMIGGLTAGVAGLMQFSRLYVGDPSVAMGKELEVIAAVVIGGGSLSGGEGSIFGTLVGALIIGIIASACSQLGLASWVQEVVTGCIIVIAVALDRLRHRRMT